jgi:hypothetical protein
MKQKTATLPTAIQIIKPLEIYSKGNVLSLFYAGTKDAMYKYNGAIFGISVSRAREALTHGDAVAYPNSFNIQKTI